MLITTIIKNYKQRTLQLNKFISTTYFRCISYLRGNRSIHLDKNVFLPYNSVVFSETSIGYATGITGKITIKGNGKVNIGKYCAIGGDVKIITHNHKVNFANLQITLAQTYKHNYLIDTMKGNVTIGSNVWIGDSVIILPGVNIGDGVVIGAGSIVTKDIPPFTIYVGNPAHLIRKRFSDNIIKQLLKMKWWDWSEEKIKQNQRFFNLDLVKNPNVNLMTLVK